MTKFHCIVCAVQSCYCLLFLLFIVLQFHKISYGERSRSLLPSMVTYMQYINSFHTRPLSMLSCRPSTCKSATLPLHKFDPFFIEIQCMSKNIKYVYVLFWQTEYFQKFLHGSTTNFHRKYEIYLLKGKLFFTTHIYCR